MYVLSHLVDLITEAIHTQRWGGGYEQVFTTSSVTC